MTKLAIILAKIIIFFGDIFKRGSALPGYIAQKIDKNIFNNLQYPQNIIMVTGTNGKTSTTNFIARIISGSPYKVIVNKEGANMPQGILTCLLRNASISGKVNSDVAVLEVDEGFLGSIISKIKPNYLLITNLFDDQVDRFGTSYDLQNKLKEIDYSGIKLVLNANDPLLVDLSKKVSADEIIYFGLDSYKDEENNFSVACPNCKKPLTYSNTMYSKIGIFSCSCGLATPKAKYLAENININSGEFTLNSHKFTSNYKTDYFIFNLLGAISICKELGLTNSLIDKQIEDFEIKGGRLEKFTFNGEDSFLNLIKNPAGLSASLSYIESLKRDNFNLYLGVNKNPADGTDVSWLSKVDFSLLKSASVNKIFIEGGALEEIKDAFRNQNIDENKIISNLSTEEIVKEMKNDNRQAFSW